MTPQAGRFLTVVPTTTSEYHVDKPVPDGRGR